jgi:protein associated with RNAse G/E
VIGLFSDEQFKELDMEAAMRFQEHKLNYKYTSDIEP